MSTPRRTRSTVLVAALLAVLLWPAAAHAADEIGFSHDGLTWSTTLPAPLFDPAVRWVPGDDRTVSFHVRNQGPITAYMTIEARSADADDLLANDDIHLRARVVGESWVPLRNGVASASLTDDSIGTGEAVQVEVNAVFDSASVNQSQVKDLPLTFTVALSELAPTPPARPPPGPVPVDPTPGAPRPDGVGPGSAPADLADRGGVLPSTGTVVGREVLLAALVLCALGAILVARRSPDDDAPAAGGLS